VKLLILGGTQFVGRAVAEAALERSHELTLFNRGRTNPELFPEAEHVRGDRDSDLSPLAGRTWDAVIDTCGYAPEAVRASVALLAGMPYAYVSSISAYADLSVGPNEETRLHKTGDGYGELKAACERELPADALVVRPGLVVGPHDHTYRFSYWVDRIARGGDVVAPEPRSAPVQFIDARDLGEWIVRCVERGTTGTFNAIGPAAPLTMERLLETIRAATGADARLHWIDEETLKRHEVEEWMELPLWLVDPVHGGMQKADNRRAIAAGLTFRATVDTVRDTLTWLESGAKARGENWEHGPVGLTPEREAELLEVAA
jgi:2'-hydroxyisoflavone reductase